MESSHSVENVTRVESLTRVTLITVTVVILTSNNMLKWWNNLPCVCFGWATKTRISKVWTDCCYFLYLVCQLSRLRPDQRSHCSDFSLQIHFFGWDHHPQGCNVFNSFIRKEQGCYRGLGLRADHGNFLEFKLLPAWRLNPIAFLVIDCLRLSFSAVGLTTVPTTKTPHSTSPRPPPNPGHRPVASECPVRRLMWMEHLASSPRQSNRGTLSL